VSVLAARSFRRTRPARPADGRIPGGHVPFSLL